MEDIDTLLSKTTRLIAFVFEMKHLVVVFYFFRGERGLYQYSLDSLYPVDIQATISSSAKCHFNGVLMGTNNGLIFQSGLDP